MRAPIAYFAGAGTVIAAIALGLGGGLTIANVLSPHQEKLEQTKLEQRMAAKPVPQPAEADQPSQQAEPAKTGAVPFVAATQAAVTANAPAAAAQPQTQATAPAPQASPQPAETKVADDPPAKSTEAPTAKVRAVAHERQSAPREQASSGSEDAKVKSRSPEDANAKAGDSDLKQLADEKRKAERHRKWADRKKAQQREAQRQQQPRDAESQGVETSVRRDSDRPRFRDSDRPRMIVRQDDDDFDRHGDSDRRRGTDRPFGFPGFNVFGGDRDD
jgi:hypothetical protein